MEETNKTNSLMRKTKAQLVDIILRKDDVEIGIRAEMAEMIEALHSAKIAKRNAEQKLEEKQKYLVDVITVRNRITSDYESICDDFASATCAYKQNLKRITKNYNIAVFLLSVAFLIATII